MNRLQYARSTYLLQHAGNPVDWYPWGEEAFSKAQAEQKPVLVSIGYAACHWCHVMERESFEDPETADLMNREFICVKVDREEHPEVDHFYMDALQALSGSGGWPLNMFVTPDRAPFYGGTYFPPMPVQGRNSWKAVLEAIAEAWKKQPEGIEQQAAQLTQHLKQVAATSTVPPQSATKGLDKELARNLLKTADQEFGGFGPAPKFPSSFALGYLLAYSGLNKEQDPESAAEAMRHARLSLDNMMAGGIYDQIGGGFARYATDKYWFAPHFEKMLYDNALLISLYASAFRWTGDPAYREVVVACVDFCDTTLKAETSPYYCCALDADSEGVEGKFYTWTHAEWQELTPAIHPAITDYFGVRSSGNWEGTNILSRAQTPLQIRARYELSEEAWKALLEAAKVQLLDVRSRRIPPALDDKALLSWNALMNIALTDAAFALDEPAYLERAARQLDFLLNAFFRDGRWYHAYKDGKAYLEANLDDLACLIKALLCYAEQSGRLEYLQKAAEITGYVERNFTGDSAAVFYFFSPESKRDIPVRKQEVYDGATPSANAVMAYNLRILSGVFHNTAWQQRSEQMLDAMQDMALRYPTSFAYWAQLLQCRTQGWMQVMVLGAPAKGELRRLKQSLGPNVYVLKVGPQSPELPATRGLDQHPESPRYLLCQDWRCMPAENDVSKLSLQIKKTK